MMLTQIAIPKVVSRHHILLYIVYQLNFQRQDAFDQIVLGERNWMCSF